ncbi:MAG: hypothetical protein CVU81_02440 [Euryarchaeota archaeon HGW-Euryarchaeota-1]|nr:MAG: hypothetical protein CVU81_02440 [Euryarchaeota archaeon HGW-Euryarchaeota-1]
MDIDDFLDDGRCITSSFAKEDYENIKKKYLQYKRDHLLLDFSDLLEIPVDCSMELPIKYLFIDEEQDLNIAQQKFIQCVSQNCKEIIYAGDDYQKIYGFMGATGCGTLISQKNIEVVILNTTYRIPSKIWRVITDFAKNNILNKAYSLDEIKSSRLGGNISFTADFQKIMDVVKNINDPCLFLLRTNKQKQIVKMKLMDEGIPFMDAVENSAWTQKLINISNAIYQLKVLNASPSELKLKMTDLIDVLPQKEYLIRGVKAKFDNNEGIDYSQIFNLNFWGSNSNMITNHLNISDNQSLALNRFWEQPKIIKNINVSIGTIHSYKGVRKSFEDCSNEKQKQNKLDDEARVFFVGITRASDNLVLYSTTLKENYLDLWGVDVSTLC